MNFLPNGPDWTRHLLQNEHLMWTGRPESEDLLIAFALLAFFSLFFGPAILMFLLFYLVLGLVYARDSYALTNRRILAYRHPFGVTARIETLPRAGTYAGPRMNRGPRAVVFTAPDRTRITFQFQSRATQRMLIDSYPKGGPFPSEGIPT